MKTFSIGFPVPEYDETRYARMVAERLGTEHHEFRVEPDGVQILPQLVWHYDEPFADSSAIPTWYVSQLTRQHVTVALTGDGGDELFAGYPRYRAVGWPPCFDRLLAAAAGASGPASGSGCRRRHAAEIDACGGSSGFARCSARRRTRRYLEWIAIFNEASRRERSTRDEFLAALA